MSPFTTILSSGDGPGPPREYMSLFTAIWSCEMDLDPREEHLPVHPYIVLR